MRRRIGVTGPQRLVLRVVGLFPGFSAGDLATIVHVHPSTWTGVIQRVATPGLLVRADDPARPPPRHLRLTKRRGRVNAARRAPWNHPSEKRLMA